LQDEILTDLAKVAELKVISRTSVMQYKTGVKRRSHHAVIRVYDEAGNVIETYEHAGEFQRVVRFPPQGTKETTNL
jgi:flagellar hook assembly protein FlgD